MSNRTRLATMLLATAFAACKCGTTPSRPAEQFIEKDAKGVLVIPSLGDAADHAQALLASARGAPGGGQLVKVSADLATKLGFDPLTRVGQKQAGLDSSRSLAISGMARSDSLMVLPYADLGVLNATVTRLLADFADRSERQTKNVGGFSVVTYEKPGEHPSFAYTTAGGNLLLAAGADPVGLAIAAAARAPEASLVQDHDYLAAKQRVGPRDLYVYNVAPEIPTMFAIPPETMFGLTAASKELAVRVNAPLPPDKSKRLSDLFAAGETSLADLPASQPVYIRGGIDWSKVIQTVEPTFAKATMNPLAALRAFFQGADVDFDAEILGNLAPGFSLTIGVAPTADVSNAFQLDPRRVNPFENYTVAGIGHVKDAAKAAATLAKVIKLADRMGATVTAKDVGGSPVYTASYELGEGLSWTLRGNELLVAGGLGDKLSTWIAAVAAHQPSLKPEQFPPVTREMLFASLGAGIAVDLGKLDEEVKNIKTGTGLSGIGAASQKSVVSGALHQVSALRPALAVTPVEGGVNVDLAVSLQ